MAKYIEYTRKEKTSKIEMKVDLIPFCFIEIEDKLLVGFAQTRLKSVQKEIEFVIKGKENEAIVWGIDNNLHIMPKGSETYIITDKYNDNIPNFVVSESELKELFDMK